MYVHALHTVYALPDLRVAAGRLRDGVSLATVDGALRSTYSGRMSVPAWISSGTRHTFSNS